MTIKKVLRLFYECEIERLDCWREDYYKTEKEAQEVGWTKKNGKVRCPSCTYREEKEKTQMNANECLNKADEIIKELKKETFEEHIKNCGCCDDRKERKLKYGRTY